jgi:hypothetical protein
MKNYPKIIFKYSWIYDQIWKEGLLMKKKKSYPSPEKVLNYIKKIEKLWRKEEKKVFQELARVTHLRWKTKTIDCFVVGRCRPFSYPLTMPIYEKHPDYFIDVLTHELIHNIFIQNKEKTEKAFQYFHKKYKKQSLTTRIHIPLHAIHSHIYYKFFNENRLKRDIKFIGFLRDYKKSWQIVEKEGYQNIISEFIKSIK